MRILVDTIWSGRAIWWKPRSDSWLRARRPTRFECFDILNQRKRQTDIGLRICGWMGLQMDEAAFPILLVDCLRRNCPSTLGGLKRWWTLVRRAAGFLVRNGPVTQQDRWEEDAGYSPFTLAVEISGLLAAADIASAVGEKVVAGYLRETADNWNDNIERWTYATDTDLARQIGVEGYYVRIAPPETECAPSLSEGFVPIKNRPPGKSSAAATHMISPDALALVRFGLRAADDPRILNTIKVIDALL